MKSICKIFLSFVIVFHCGIFVSEGNAQSITWMRYFNPTGFIDRGIDVVQDSDSSYVFLANTSSGICLIKTNLLGQVVWQKFLGDSTGSGSRSMCLTSDGGIAIAGQSSSPISSMQLIKTNNDGNVLWIRKYINSGRSSRAFSVKETSDKGFIMCGDIYPATPNEVYVVKTDSTGNLQWHRQYYGVATYDIVQSRNGNYYTVGFFVLRKLDNSGNEIWTLPVGGAQKLAESEDGNIYVGGGQGQFYLVKVDTSCKKVFERNYFSNAYGHGLCIKGNGSIVLAGSVITDTGTTKTNLDVLIAEFDSSGNTIRGKVLSLGKTIQGFPTQEGIENIKLSSDGGFVACGTTDYPTGNELYDNILAVKTDSLLNTSTIVKINTITQNIPFDFSLYQNYPNPFNSSTIIKYAIKEETFVKLFITDVTGKIIKMCLSENQKTGEYKYRLDANNLSSGVYFINLFTKAGHKIKSMLLLK